MNTMILHCGAHSPHHNAYCWNHFFNSFQYLFLLCAVSRSSFHMMWVTHDVHALQPPENLLQDTQPMPVRESFHKWQKTMLTPKTKHSHKVVDLVMNSQAGKLEGSLREYQLEPVSLRGIKTCQRTKGTKLEATERERQAPIGGRRALTLLIYVL